MLPILSLNCQACYVNSVAFGADALLASADSTDVVKIWDCRKGTLVTEFTHDVDHIMPGYAWLAFLASSSKLICLSEDGEFVVYDLIRHGIESVIEHNDQVTAVNCNGKSVILGTQDGYVSLWDVATGSSQRLCERLPGPVDAVSITADASAFVVGTPFGVWEGKVQAGEVTRLDIQPTHAVAYSPDGKWLAVATDYGIRSWGPHNIAGQLRATADDDRLTFLTYSPDSKFLIRGNARLGVGNASVSFLKVDDLQLALILYSNASRVDSIAISNHLHLVAAGTGNGTVDIWGL